MHSYNNTCHRSIGLTPAAVNQSNQESIWQRLEKTLDKNQNYKLVIAFKKGYMANWSEEIFMIRDVHQSDPLVFSLIDARGETLDSTFYESEVQKVLARSNKRYRIEAVLRRRTEGKRTQVLVKWCGYPDSSNSWIDEKTPVKYKG